MLIDEGAGLNLLSQEAFKKLQVPSRRLKPSLPFYGVTPGHTLPLEQVELPVTFGSRDNFRMENVVFDIAEVPLPYNAILRRPALARFMVVTHYAYLTVKMPGLLAPSPCPSRSATPSPMPSSYTLLGPRSKDTQGAQDPLHPNPNSPPTPLI